MKPFAHLQDRYAEDRTPSKVGDGRLERVWIKIDGKLERHYVVRAR